jgi:hypothetical protein
MEQCYFLFQESVLFDRLKPHRVRSIWSTDVSVKRLSYVNKTIPAAKCSWRYWHAEQRPRSSYTLPLCQSYPGTTTAYLISESGRRVGEVAVTGTLYACAALLNYQNKNTYRAYSTSSNGTNTERRTSGSMFSDKVYGEERKCRTRENWCGQWKNATITQDGTLTSPCTIIQQDLSLHLKSQACCDVTPFRLVNSYQCFKGTCAFRAMQYKKPLRRRQYCKSSYERTNGGSGWSDNADCPVLRNYVYRV